MQTRLRHSSVKHRRKHGFREKPKSHMKKLHKFKVGNARKRR